MARQIENRGKREREEIHKSLFLLIVCVAVCLRLFVLIFQLDRKSSRILSLKNFVSDRIFFFPPGQLTGFQNFFSHRFEVDTMFVYFMFYLQLYEVSQRRMSINN